MTVVSDAQGTIDGRGKVLFHQWFLVRLLAVPGYFFYILKRCLYGRKSEMYRQTTYFASDIVDEQAEEAGPPTKKPCACGSCLHDRSRCCLIRFTQNRFNELRFAKCLHQAMGRCDLVVKEMMQRLKEAHVRITT